MSHDIEHPYLLGYQVGVNLALNAIKDAYLVVDGPNCVIFRTSQIQGNHDWHADLLRSNGLHRVTDTDCTTERAAIGDDRLLISRLREVASQADCKLILVSSMSPVAVTGRQYDKVLADLSEEIEQATVNIPCGSLIGDWLHGYTWTLKAIAQQLPLSSETSRDPSKVALIGHLWDRNESDNTANLAELKRLLAGLGLELCSCWLDGGPADSLRAVAEAECLIALPYGREAAKILAGRTGAKKVECDLPIGLEGTCRWLRTIASALDRSEQAEAFIDAELARVAPKLEWVLPHALFDKRLAVVADPHLAWAFCAAAKEFGCRVVLRAYWADESHVLSHEREGPGTLLVNPQTAELSGALQEELSMKGLDLIVSNSHALLIHGRFGRPEPVPFVELGFPSYYSHALFDSPYLGFAGSLRLVDRLSNALSRAAVRRDARPDGGGQND